MLSMMGQKTSSPLRAKKGRGPWSGNVGCPTCSCGTSGPCRSEKRQTSGRPMAPVPRPGAAADFRSFALSDLGAGNDDGGASSPRGRPFGPIAPRQVRSEPGTRWVDLITSVGR